MRTTELKFESQFYFNENVAGVLAPVSCVSLVNLFKTLKITIFWGVSLITIYAIHKLIIHRAILFQNVLLKAVVNREFLFLTEEIINSELSEGELEICA